MLSSSSSSWSGVFLRLRRRRCRRRRRHHRRRRVGCPLLAPLRTHFQVLQLCMQGSRQRLTRSSMRQRAATSCVCATDATRAHSSRLFRSLEKTTPAHTTRAFTSPCCCFCCCCCCCCGCCGCCGCCCCCVVMVSGGCCLCCCCAVSCDAFTVATDVLLPFIGTLCEFDKQAAR